ncbi:MAG: tetratricopeptide repeat protein [Bryobacteraceae bacterium]
MNPSLDEDTARKIGEQKSWIAAEPANPRPYYHLAQLYRLQGRQDEALGLILEAVRLDPDFGAAHIALSEIYCVRADYPAAWRHARSAERNGLPAAVDLLTRYGIAEGG